MINKQLEININEERILQRISENLNINFVTPGSNIKKLADAYTAENISFANNMDATIANGFLTTMSSEFLELFGNQNHVYRKNYSTISLYSYQSAVRITVNKDEAFVTTLDKDYVAFKKGDTLYADDYFIIQTLSDIIISDMQDDKYISIIISLNLDVQEHMIDEGAYYRVTPTNTDLAVNIPILDLHFDRAVGLALLQETLEDYRLRIYETTYLANNGANSLVSAITKEVPFIHYIEVDNYTDGKGIKTLYPYTKELIDSGTDDMLENLILPLVQTNLKNKILYGQLIEVLKPESLILNVEIKTKNRELSVNLLENTRLIFNNVFTTSKKINRQVLEDFFKSELNLINDEIDFIKFIFTSPYVSEETFTLTDNTKDITLPIGRFLYLSKIDKVT